MRTVVVKFGGTSLADAGQISHAAAIIRKDPARRYVVASAPGKRNAADIKVTDMLYQCYDLACAGGEYLPVLEQIKQRYADIIRDLAVDFDLDAEIEIVRQHLAGQPQRDYMASRGEYLNSKVLAAYLGFAFVDTAPYVRFSADGKFEDEETNQNLRCALEHLEYAVLPGFYGADEQGTIHTFSRGGSDITGSLVARAVNADLYENWTDVSGMLFTDPRIVENPKTIEYVTYSELRELSYMGASVLHEDAVFPVRKARIPINIRNTNRPEDAGTMIMYSLPAALERKNVVGVAGRKGFTSITMEKAMMNSEVGFGAKLMNILARHNIPWEHCPTGIDALTVVINSEYFRKDREAVLAEIKEVLQPDDIYVHDSMAVIAVVVHGMFYAKGSAALIFNALADAGINLRMVDLGSSMSNILIGVEESDFEKSIRTIYDHCNSQYTE